MAQVMNLYEAKTNLSSLVDRAAYPSVAPFEHLHFDRVIVAQALSRGLLLVHADRAIQAYPRVPQMWAA